MTDEIERGCIEVFKQTTGMKHTASGDAMADAEILAKPIGDFDIDSLETMEFIMGVAERFGVQLDEEAVNRCATISELAALVTASRSV